jgi:hypothetical protein
LKGLKIPEAANKRFIICKESWFFSEIGEHLQKHWTHQGYKPVSKVMPEVMVTVGGLFSSQMATMGKSWGKP